MVDVRKDVCGIIVGGSPAPGVNGVISAVVIRCFANGMVPIGFIHGFKHLREGLTSHYVELKTIDVSRRHNSGGSILSTSQLQLENSEHINNCIRSLEYLRVKYLVTIGGSNTALSAHRLAHASVDQKTGLQIVHVPKTIFNDLPLPNNCYTFGYSTARFLSLFSMFPFFIFFCHSFSTK